MPVQQELFQAISVGNRDLVAEIVRKAVDENVDLEGMLNETMIPAMRHVGEKFSRREIYVPEMLIAARAMQAGLEIIEPLLAVSGHEARAKVCVGTVAGDLHDIGKNLVIMMLKGAGFDVEDLGVDCGIEKYQDAVERGYSIVCLSALLTTTMTYMKDVVDHFSGDQGVKIVIGGAPITQEYADEIGADAFGTDANDAVSAVERCLTPT